MALAMSTSTVTPFTQYATDIMHLRYSHTVQGRKETWDEIAQRVVSNVMGMQRCSQYVSREIRDSVYFAIVNRKFIPGGRILSQAGRKYHQTDNCYCLQVDDSREGWAELVHKCTMMFMSGGGVGCDYSNLRPYGSALHRSGGISSGPLPLIKIIDSIAEGVRQGGERRGANYASLAWDHDDIIDFIKMKEDGGSLQHTNISVRYNAQFFHDLSTDDNYDRDWNYKFYDAGKYANFMQTLHHACKYGDPGFQFDNDEQILRNACTEVISSDDSDSCCLGSVNLANIDSLAELAEVTQLGTLFLLCNTLYTDKPTDKVAQVKEKNRRLGLGLMGVAEWFMQRQLPYGYVRDFIRDSDYVGEIGNVNDGFTSWLQKYKVASDNAADIWAGKLQVARPIAVRAIAPTGTISIVGGHTTPGIEPVFHTAYMRTYNTLKSQEHSNGYVTEKIIDPIVQKWMELGYDVRDIDTAYTLSQSVEGIERRISFQAYCQRFVDNAISSTVNLPKYVDGIENAIAPILLKYLPQLRGITFYPDGRYGNQPVVPIDIDEVMVMRESESCKGGICGI